MYQWIIAVRKNMPPKENQRWNDFRVQTTPFGCHGNGCKDGLTSATYKLCFPSQQMNMNLRASPVSYDCFWLFDDEARTELETRLITTKRPCDDVPTWRKFMKFILHVYRFELLPFVQIISVDFFDRSPMVCLFDRKWEVNCNTCSELRGVLLCAEWLFLFSFNLISIFANLCFHHSNWNISSWCAGFFWIFSLKGLKTQYLHFFFKQTKYKMVSLLCWHKTIPANSIPRRQVCYVNIS